MNRRKALVTIGFTALGSTAWSLTRSRLLAAEPNAGLDAAGTQASNQAIDDRLRKDFAHRSERINSEEGIPMFLACEDLVPHGSAPAVVALTPLNAALASALHRNADAWLRIHPDAQYKDIASVIEVLADRDFTHGGTAEAL